MLDKKTKDIDANIELLMDRKKNNQVWGVFALIFASVSLISGVLLEINLLCFMGIAILIVASLYVLEDVSYKFFIQVRRMINNQEDQTALLFDVLDELDSLKDKNKKVKK